MKICDVDIRLDGQEIPHILWEKVSYIDWTQGRAC